MYALILIAPVLFALQSAAFKQHANKCDTSGGATIFFTIFYFAISALASVGGSFLFGNTVSVDSLLFGVIYGILFYGFATLYSSAMKEGPLSITSFIFSCSMVIPIILSVIVYNESVSLLKIIGFILMIIALYFINFANSHSTRVIFTKKWVFICILGVICNGLLQFSMKYYNLTATDPNLGQFLAVGYTIATIIALVRISKKSYLEDMKHFKMNWWFIGLGLIVVLANTVGNGMFTYLAPIMPATLLYPVTNGSSVMVSIAISAIFMKEELSSQALMGIIIGIIAIILLSL